jgi:hypothetical protein
MVRQGNRIYLAMTVEVSRLTGAATVTLPGPDVTIGTPPRVTAEQQAKLDACQAEQAAKMAENSAKSDARRAWQNCRAQPVNCPYNDSASYLRCLEAGPNCGPEPERVNRYADLFSSDGIACQATSGIPVARTKRGPGRVIELARYDSISNDVACVCKWDHCVVR